MFFLKHCHICDWNEGMGALWHSGEFSILRARLRFDTLNFLAFIFISTGKQLQGAHGTAPVERLRRSAQPPPHSRLFWNMPISSTGRPSALLNEELHPL